ncbi:MAG: thioredoxin domain-containing protein [Rhodospirillales bacterium]|nr:thioredoxin domain-containing protein [Rhodospirillales bacterium]
MTNRLADETSPYLQQHKDNPVHWWPWGEAALEAARDQDKPILLSVGYAACHWCHVMAHESFESAEIAAVMNDRFINIKVDREERPDIDAVYQSALQMMGEQGGWPLTMFLMPDGSPFWGGTYFPSTAKYGRPGFPDILRSIAATFQNEPAKVMENARAFKDGLARLSRPEGGGALSLERLDEVAALAVQYVDTVKGGTQGAPKFPQPSFFDALWRAYKRPGRHTGKDIYKNAVTLTLDQICQGGIYDHLAGGFARYSTDEVWLAPHFEKMLYDNALLIELLTDVWTETKSPLYAVRIAETIDWLMREMRSSPESSPDGPFAFTAAQDADSEGEEGKFAVWTEAEIDDALETDSEFFKSVYSVTARGNWEGKTILNRSAKLALGTDEDEARLRPLREKLFAVRQKRIPPQRDDKVLADWNGLTISALAKAGAVFDKPEWVATAEAVFLFVTDTMTLGGRLRHAWCAGRLNHPATLDDYANMGQAALALYGVTGSGGYLEQARAWVDVADEYYWDEDGHAYFLAAADTDDVIARTKTVHDNAVPSGNGVMAEVLARLFYLTGEGRYRERCEQLIKALAAKEPGQLAYQSSLLAGFEILESAQQVVIIGGDDDPETAGFRRAFFAAGLSNGILAQFPPGAGLPDGHPAQGKEQVAGQVTVYVCTGPTCGLPLTEVSDLREALAQA